MSVETRGVGADDGGCHTETAALRARPMMTQRTGAEASR
jgi:hypothetical protein